MLCLGLKHQYLGLPDDNIEIIQVRDHRETHQPLLQFGATISCIALLKKQVVRSHAKRSRQPHEREKVRLPNIGIIVANPPLAQTGEPRDITLGQTQLSGSNAKIGRKWSHRPKMSRTRNLSHVQCENPMIPEMGILGLGKLVSSDVLGIAKATGRILFVGINLIAICGAHGQEPFDLGAQPGIAQTNVTAPSAEIIEPYEGWWGFEGQDACTHPDPDNWWRVAFGRMHITEDGVQFGSGQTQFRMYDAGCDLHDVTVRDGSGDAAAICQNDDGDELTGRFSFMSVPGDRLAVSSPLGDYLLDRCDAPLSTAEIEQPLAEAPKLQPPPSDIAPAPVPSKSSNGPIIRPVFDGPVAPSTIPVAQRTSIGLVYRDHCDPNFGAAYDLSGPSDPELYQPYTNQLLIKYGADCTKFYASEVSQIIAIRDVAALVPPATGTSQLDENGAMALGLWLFLAHNPDIGVCMNDEAARRAFVQDQAVAGLVPYGTQDALSWLAKGYASGLETWVLAQQQRRLPVCHVFSTQVVHVGLPFLALSSANFDFGR